MFTVGAAVFVIRRKWGLECGADGPVNAHTDIDNRVIWLDGDLPAERFRSTLSHELEHLWEYLTGRSKTGEERARLASLIQETFNRDWAAIACDGMSAEQVIDLIPIEGTRDIKERPAPLREQGTHHTRQCLCGCSIAGGSISNGSPILIGPISWMHTRWFVCRVCDRVPVWDEHCDGLGISTGAVIRGVVLEGAEANKWIRDHAGQLPAMPDNFAA